MPPTTATALQPPSGVARGFKDEFPEVLLHLARRDHGETLRLRICDRLRDLGVLTLALHLMSACWKDHLDRLRVGEDEWFVGSLVRDGHRPVVPQFARRLGRWPTARHRRITDTRASAIEQPHHKTADE